MQVKQREILSKVPEVTLTFWIVKIFATTLGETGGDALSMSMNLGYLTSGICYCSSNSDFSQEVSSCRLLDDNRSNYNGGHDAGRFCRSIVGNWLCRWLGDSVQLINGIAMAVVSDAGLGSCRNHPVTPSRSVLLGNDYVFPNIGDGTWGLDCRSKRSGAWIHWCSDSVWWNVSSNCYCVLPHQNEPHDAILGGVHLDATARCCRRGLLGQTPCSRWLGAESLLSICNPAGTNRVVRVFLSV
jgi:hypothetical protein